MEVSNYYSDYYHVVAAEEEEDYPPYCLKRSDSSGSVTESSISSEFEHGSNNFSYEEHCGPGLKSFLVKRLNTHLSILGISPFLFEKMTNDILRLSENEPYGIRGATVIFRLYDSKGRENKSFKLQPVKIDVGCVSTFRLIFSLKEESLMISNIGRVLHGLFFKSWKKGGFESSKEAPRICLDYQVSKRQLYRSNDYY